MIKRNGIVHRCANALIVGIEYVMLIKMTIMKKLFLLFIVLLSVGAIAQNFVTSVPNWYSDPPKSIKKYYGVGAGSSMAIDIAESKALLNAKTQIAEQVGKVGLTDKKVTSKVGVNGKQEEVYQTKTIEANLSGVKIIKKAIMQDGKEYTVYVLVEMKRRK